MQCHWHVVGALVKRRGRGEVSFIQTYFKKVKGFIITFTLGYKNIFGCRNECWLCERGEV